MKYKTCEECGKSFKKEFWVLAESRTYACPECGTLELKHVISITSLDGYTYNNKVFRSLRSARAYAHKWVGETPDLGSTYAVSFDGIVKLTYNHAMKNLFPESTTCHEGEYGTMIHDKYILSMSVKE